MDEISVVGGSLTRLLAVCGGVLSGVMLAYAGFMWITSEGEPQKVSRARNAFLGAVVGLMITGGSFVLPRALSEVVIEPVGGVTGGVNAGVDCDRVLRRQFVLQRGASTAGRMNVVIGHVQGRWRECSIEVWDPVVDDSGYSVVVGQGVPNTAGACFSTPPERGAAAMVGMFQVPRGLREKKDVGLAARSFSGRDSENNVIVYWGRGDRRPSDGASCWMYVSRARRWFSGY